MWAHVLVEPSKFAPIEVPAFTEADVAENWVLLRAVVGGVCGSDLPYFRGRAHKDTRDSKGWASGVPGLPLHEVVGEVLFSRHPAHQIGDMVVGWASKFDAITEFVLADGESLLKYNPAFSAVEAITIQPLACVIGAVERLNIKPGDRAAVVGQGPIGLLFSHVLSNAGAVVTGVDRIDRTAAADIFGVTETVTTMSDRWANASDIPERFPIVVEAIGHQIATLTDVMTAAELGGQVFYFGVPDDPIYPISMQMMFRKHLALISGATIDRRRLLALANDYLLEHEGLRTKYVTNVYPVADVQQAFDAAVLPAPGQYKIALDMAG